MKSAGDLHQPNTLVNRKLCKTHLSCTIFAESHHGRYAHFSLFLSLYGGPFIFLFMFCVIFYSIDAWLCGIKTHTLLSQSFLETKSLCSRFYRAIPIWFFHSSARIATVLHKSFGIELLCMSLIKNTENLKLKWANDMK